MKNKIKIISATLIAFSAFIIVIYSNTPLGTSKSYGYAIEQFTNSDNSIDNLTLKGGE